ncbi:maleylacetoacetate isomerase [Pseudoalteromonas carrageenovora]|uniref:Maleylpyruvate isomerase n=1 Tax=Pseudoalteromonas carrageenovora IAM 12662 TaxID=1314868 RepID=A0A2K4XF72_PSEVC|nr:maleylacetoacetate isomerase [Pseudoalteromonas carrageenovora]MBE0384574.1 maleylpyruvate isomerase [Pseudoalteromonas carrageenovora IAM 12662]QBJ73591.1 maleylacetoacetate isomerase [Pseudoalteromonas carrageenovora]GEB70870.1 maleylacetoacetate isomerase [Pseudoalteromonas carrageenovora]SOU42957.1 putative maleylacetoacetate isomerase [Pseudoalteromonas carrageenovora IAM 12662]
MKLYSYFRSSAAYRVRIALNLKAIDYDLAIVNLLKSQQLDEGYLAVNPQGLLPALETEEGYLAQSLAIIEWLDETYPQSPIIAGSAWQKAKIRNISYAIACDIHPVNNLRVLKYLSNELNVDDEAKNKWYRHWIEIGFEKIELMLSDSSDYCVGDQPTLADICLVPQVFNALRFKVDMAAYPKIAAIYERCNKLAAFDDAAPQNQPDAI